MLKYSLINMRCLVYLLSIVIKEKIEDFFIKFLVLIIVNYGVQIRDKYNKNEMTVRVCI
jgi:hypothetical protein